MRESLLVAYRRELPVPSHVSAFAAWITRGTLEDGSPIASASLQVIGLARRPEHCAVLGYSIHAGIRKDATIDLFESDVRQLSGRRFFEAGRPPAFEVDGVAILGIALGLAAIGKQGAEADWLKAITEEALRLVNEDRWQSSLIHAANYLLGKAQDMKLAIGEVEVAVSSRLARPFEESRLEQAWALVAAMTPHNDGPSRTATQVAIVELALERAATVPLVGLSVNGVVTFLRGVQQSMRLWTWETTSRTGNSMPRQWHIDHEYHVQNLLWSVLAPLLPDLEDELYLPSIGQKTPRADLGIPSLRTIVEVKFIKKKGAAQFRRTIEEIAIDASLYLTEESKYDYLIPFIWDEYSQNEEYAEAIAGLKKITGIVDVVILPRPAKMS